MSITNCPIRSISLPSRLYPNSLRMEAALDNLKAWQMSSLAWPLPLRAEIMQTGLLGLAEMYVSVNELIRSPLTLQGHKQLVDEALDEQIGILDLCDTLRDLIIKMKEHVQDLQSALRRKATSSSIKSSIRVYMSFRKKVKYDVSKSLIALKRKENSSEASPSMVVRFLRDVSTVTVSLLRSVLLFMTAPVMTKVKPGGWSLISKMTGAGSRSSSEKGEKNVNDVGCVDLALHNLSEHAGKDNDTKLDVRFVLKKLEELARSIEGLEGGLDCVYKRLVRTRVSLLNILAH